MGFADPEEEVPFIPDATSFSSKMSRDLSVLPSGSGAAQGKVSGHPETQHCFDLLADTASSSSLCLLVVGGEIA